MAIGGARELVAEGEEPSGYPRNFSQALNVMVRVDTGINAGYVHAATAYMTDKTKVELLSYSCARLTLVLSREPIGWPSIPSSGTLQRIIMRKYLSETSSRRNGTPFCPNSQM
jgi:hypothetical protein